MNKKQKIILWLGMAVIVLMTCFPPILVQETYETDKGSTSFRRVVRYDFLITKYFREIYFERLFLEWFIALTVIIGLLCIVKDVAFRE